MKTINNKQYIIQEAWPDNIFLQCGAEGIVVGLKSGKTRKTAFFEAFPFSKFIRGEGETIEQAEKECFEKYLVLANCKHDLKIDPENSRDDKCVICGAKFENKNIKIMPCVITGKEEAIYRKYDYVEKKETFYSPEGKIILKNNEIKDIILGGINKKEIEKKKESKNKSLVNGENSITTYIEDLEMSIEELGGYLSSEEQIKNYGPQYFIENINILKFYESVENASNYYQIYYKIFENFLLGLSRNIYIDNTKDEKIFFRKPEQIRYALISEHESITQKKIKENSYIYENDTFIQSWAKFVKEVIEIIYKIRVLKQNTKDLTNEIENTINTFIDNTLNWLVENRVLILTVPDID